MRRYWPGILMGTVLSVLMGVALALTVNKERRRQLSHRFEALRKALPGKEELKQTVHQAATTARKTGSHLEERVQESASILGQHAREMVSAAQQTATSVGANLHTKSADLVNGLRERG